MNYVRDRTVFGKPIADLQGIRWKLADMYKDIEAARGLLYRACLTANPFPDPFMAATAKVFCNEMAIRVTNEAVQLAWRLWLHRRISGLAALPRRSLRHARRWRVGDAARPDRPQASSRDLDFDQGVLGLGTLLTCC